MTTNNVISLASYRAEHSAESIDNNGLLREPLSYYEHPQLGNLSKWDDELHHFVLTRLSELYTDPNHSGKAGQCSVTGMMMMATRCLFEEQGETADALLEAIHYAACCLENYGGTEEVSGVLGEIEDVIEKYWTRQTAAKDS